MKCQMLICLNSPTLTFSTISNLEHRRFARSTTHLRLVTFSHIQLLSSWSKKLCNLEKWYNYLSQAFNHEDSQQKTSKNSMLLCNEARRSAWRVTTDIARFQLFQGFDEWDWTFKNLCACTYFQQTAKAAANQSTNLYQVTFVFFRVAHLQPVDLESQRIAPQCSKPQFCYKQRKNCQLVFGGSGIDASGNFSCFIFFFPIFLN